MIHRSTLNICHQYVLGISLLVKWNGIIVIVYLKKEGTKFAWSSINSVSKYNCWSKLKRLCEVKVVITRGKGLHLYRVRTCSSYTGQVNGSSLSALCLNHMNKFVVHSFGLHLCNSVVRFFYFFAAKKWQRNRRI